MNFKKDGGIKSRINVGRTDGKFQYFTNIRRALDRALRILKQDGEVQIRIECQALEYFQEGIYYTTYDIKELFRPLKEVN